MAVDSKPHVAILHFAAPPIIGGVESTIAAHAQLLADHGYAVKIIAGRGEQSDPRIPLLIIPMLDSKHTLTAQVTEELLHGVVPSDLSFLINTLANALSETLRDVDILIAHNVPTLHKNLALTAALHEFAQSSHVRLIAWCHDFAWTDPVYTDELHPGFPWDLIRRVWPNTTYVVVSEARRIELAHLLDLDESKISVVPPGLDVHAFFGLTEMTLRWVRNLSLLEDAPLLLLPARVTRRKNIELAIEITAAFRELGHSAKLVVMGPLGPHNATNVDYLNELCVLRHERRVDDAVIFLHEYGTVSDFERRDLYALADALLFPSEREGFGIPILEAGLARLPIFCADIPPFRESAGDHAYYFALDESPRAITARLADFFEHDSRYQLKQRVLRDYTWERIFSERIEPLLHSRAVD
jgi:glycosyltransferase involved in cell wall biosynthesis